MKSATGFRIQVFFPSVTRCSQSWNHLEGLVPLCVFACVWCTYYVPNLILMLVTHVCGCEWVWVCVCETWLPQHRVPGYWKVELKVCVRIEKFLLCSALPMTLATYVPCERLSEAMKQVGSFGLCPGKVVLCSSSRDDSSPWGLL